VPLVNSTAMSQISVIGAITKRLVSALLTQASNYSTASFGSENGEPGK
jgi:hypothetical protein